MRVKYTAKWGLQIAEMIFQTRSKADAERLPVPGWGNMGRVTLS
ncbi:MAG: DUF6783 domain-containing protein [Lachnospiraceae bacterium]|nr:DUF6783 domain-containing protein [Lachnospiraceae bacterium]